MNRYALEGAIRRAVSDTWGHILLNGDTELADAALTAMANEKRCPICGVGLSEDDTAPCDTPLCPVQS